MDSTNSASSSAAGLAGMVRNLVTADTFPELAERVLEYFEQVLSTSDFSTPLTKLVIFRDPVTGDYRVFNGSGPFAEALLSTRIPLESVSEEQWRALAENSRSHSVEWERSRFEAVDELSPSVYLSCVPLQSDGTLSGCFVLLGEESYSLPDSFRFLSHQFGETIGEIILFKQNSWEVKERLKTFETLERFYEGINRLREWEEILVFCLETFQKLFDAPDGSIMIYDRERDQLQVEHASVDLKGSPKVFQLGEGVAGTALEEKQIINLPDVSESPFFERYDNDQPGRSLKSLLCVPLWTSRGPVGVVNLSDHEEFREFDMDRVPGVEILQSRLAAALENVITNQRLEKVANTDELTGIYNRRYINQKLESLFDAAPVQKTPFGIILVDLDGFKQINDQHGHQEGDRVLKAFAESLEEQCRADDLVGRFGGDEFIYLMPDTEASCARKQAESLLEALIGLKVETEQGVEIDPQASLGLAVVDEETDSLGPDGLIRRADHCLYRAKEEEGLSLVIAEEELDPASSDN